MKKKKNRKWCHFFSSTCHFVNLSFCQLVILSTILSNAVLTTWPSAKKWCDNDRVLKSCNIFWSCCKIFVQCHKMFRHAKCATIVCGRAVKNFKKTSYGQSYDKGSFTNKIAVNKAHWMRVLTKVLTVILRTFLWWVPYTNKVNLKRPFLLSIKPPTRIL